MKKIKKLFKNNSVVSVIGIILLIIGVAAGIMLVKQRQLFQQKAAPATTISLLPATTNVAPGESFSIDLNIDTAANQFVGYEIYLSYDPSLISIDNVTAVENFFPSQTTDLDFATPGRISLVAFTTPPSGSAVSKTGKIMTIEGTALAEGTATISYLPDTLIAGYGDDAGSNVISQSNPAQVIIELVNPTETSTVTPTQTLTITPSPTVTQTQGNPTEPPTGTPTPTTASGGNNNNPTNTNTPTPTTKKNTATPTRTIASKNTSTPYPTSSLILPTPFEEETPLVALPKARLVPGDANRDGCVNMSDFFAVLFKMFRKAAWDSNEDVNRDGKVGFDDLFLVFRNLNKGCGQ